MMNSAWFVAAVMSRLPAIVDDDDRERVRFSVAQRHRQGWSITDTVRYELCSEEVDSDVDEAAALREMDAIARKYSPAVKNPR